MKVYLVAIDWEGCLPMVLTSKEKALEWAQKHSIDAVLEVEVDAEWELRDELEIWRRPE